MISLWVFLAVQLPLRYPLNIVLSRVRLLTLVDHGWNFSANLVFREPIVLIHIVSCWIGSRMMRTVRILLAEMRDVTWVVLT